MIKDIRIWFAVLFVTVSTGVNAQGNFFSKDGEEAYISNLETIFSINTDRRATRDFITRVNVFWTNPETSPELKTIVMSVSDKIHEKRGRAFPDYHNYLSTILTFAESNHPHESFNNWHNGINTLLSNSRYPLRHANRLFELALELLSDNTVYSTAALKWHTTSKQANYAFTDSLYLNINNTTLVCKVRNDSITVIKTDGRINLMSGIWYGERGIIDWQQNGFDSDMVYASFNNYTIDMSRNEMRVDDVEFYNRHYFDYALKGRIHNRVMTIRSPENTTYPKFESHEQRYKIDNIHEGFNYEGGFSQHGAKFLGSGTTQNPAVINIFRNDTLFITAKSLYFALRKEQIVSSDTEITMHLDTGYIYHPGLLFKYMDPVKEVHLIRDGEGISRSPFFNTYHNISMDAEMIRWKTSEMHMELRMISGASENHAFFESISYFREEFFNNLQGMDAIHPLQGLLNCSRRFKGNPFTAKDYAAFLGLPESPVRQQVIGLSFHGFVSYNVNTDTIQISERLTDYLLFRAGRKDYDVIRFKSLTPGSLPNAVFDLKNYDLALNGVAAISISDRQNVVFFPENEKILMKKDRNFSFDGSIAAGMINLYGNSFIFNYQEFRIDLNIIDSVSLRVETEGYDYTGRRAQNQIKSTIARLSGFLEIDREDNKSGKETYAEYPRLTSKSNSYVYYDYPNTQNGAYDRESFYFELEPFEIDSINSLTRQNIAFEGTFTSNIFPNIDETLVVRPDYSLGFRRTSPPQGYPIYNERASFNNIVDLSNVGLIGTGTLSYITATAESRDFTFLPEETKGLAHIINIQPQESGIEYPDLQGQHAQVNYLPFIDKFIAQVKEQPFTMYNGEGNFDGSVTVSPNGLEGSGQFNMEKANLVAKKFDLGHHVVMADSSDFNLVSDPGTNDVNFRTSNLLSTIDFKTRKGSFTARDAGSKVEFTENRYLAYISEFSWDIDKNDIYLGARGSVGNRFVSTHRRQDSLEFIVPIALYDVEARKIFAEEVRSIRVADTEMLLNDGKVTINSDAVLSPLQQVNIVLNDSIHRFYDANVTVEGKFAYQATAKYDYTNGNNDVKQLNFSKIDVDRDRKTKAEGAISEREFFTFNRYFGYKGDVSLRAGNRLLSFKGGAQMLHDCSVLGPQDYVRFESAIDPQDVKIPLGESTQNFEFENIYRNIYLNRDSNIIYSSFFEDRIFHSDVPVLTANGFLHFNDELNSFVIAEQHKIANPDTTGNVMRFQNDGCLVTGEGNINMGLNLEQVKTFATGDVTHFRSEAKVEMLTMFGLDFMLDNRSIEIMVNSLQNANPKNKVKTINTSTKKRMSQWMGSTTTETIAKEMQENEPLRTLPAAHQHTLVLDSLTWTWDVASRSYITNTQAMVSWIRNFPINQKVDVKAAIAFSRGGNSLDLYISASDSVYYFFSYRNGVMQTRSSSAEYNTNVQTLKADDRKMKTRMGERPYSFIMAPESRLRRLLKMFEEGAIQEIDEEEQEESNDENGEVLEE